MWAPTLAEDQLQSAQGTWLPASLQGSKASLPNMGQAQCEAFWFEKNPLFPPSPLEMGSVLILYLPG